MDSSSSKTLYIHIGSPKTGSTALQNFFALNEKQLGKKGLYYPKYKRYDVVNNHLYFSQLVVKSGMKRGRVITSKDRQKAKRKVYNYLKRVALDAGTRHSILLSGEEMFFARDLSTLEDVRSMFSSVKIIIYLRRQDQFLQSFYLQGYKKGKIREPIREHTYLVDKFWLDYLARLETWAEIFERKNIIVRPFEKKQFYQDNLFSDFLHNTMNLELTGDLVIPEREQSNLRVDIDIYETMQLINSFDLPRKELRKLIDRLQSFPATGEKSNTQHALLSPLECHEIIKRFEAGNCEIARNYLCQPENPLFLDPYPDLTPPESPQPEYSAERVARVLLWLLIGMQKEVSWHAKLKRMVKKLVLKL